MCKKYDTNICPECNSVADSKNACQVCQEICKKCLNAHNNIAYLFPHAVDEIYENDAEQLAKVTHSRSNKKILWKCNNSPDHPTYEKSPYAKFMMDRGCPICMKQRNSSKQELRLLAEVSAKFPIAMHQVDIQNKKFNVDVLVELEECSVIVEMDGFKGHGLIKATAQLKKDIKRHKKLVELCYKVIRVRDSRLNGENLGMVYFFDNQNETSLRRAIHLAIKNIYDIEGTICPFDANNTNNYFDENSYQELCSNRDIPEIERSLSSDPRLKRIYSNKNKRPASSVYLGSNERYFFNCEIDNTNCLKDFKQSPKSAARTDILACKNCIAAEKSRRQKKSVLNKRGSFADKHPQLLPGWNQKNDLKPTDIPPGSGEEIIYNCLECGVGRPTSVSNISDVGTGLCHKCGNKKNGESRRKHADTIAEVRPDFIDFWIQEKNVDTPYDCPIGLREQRWLYCRNEKCNKPYKRTVSTLVRGKGLCHSCSKSHIVLKQHSAENWLKYKSSK